MNTISRRFKNSITCFSLVIFFVGMSTPCHAVMGVGDISFDPTVYAQLISIYNQGMEILNTSKTQLQTMEKVNRALQENKQGVDGLQNIELQKAANGLMSNDTNNLAALRSEFTKLEGKPNSNNDLIQLQLKRIKNLEVLNMLEQQSTKNLDRASDKTSADASAKITAQSTAALASLAAAERQRKVEEDIAAAAAAEQRRNLTTGAAAIYEAVR